MEYPGRFGGEEAEPESVNCAPSIFRTDEDPPAAVGLKPMRKLAVWPGASINGNPGRLLNTNGELEPLSQIPATEPGAVPEFVTLKVADELVPTCACGKNTVPPGATLETLPARENAYL